MSKIPAKTARSNPSTLVRAATVAVQTSLLSCRKPGKARVFTSDQEITSSCHFFLGIPGRRCGDMFGHHRAGVFLSVPYGLILGHGTGLETASCRNDCKPGERAWHEC